MEGEAPADWWRGPRRSVAVLLAIAAVLRVAQIDVAAQVDEVYHVLAALSWLQDGTFAVGDGSYTRARGYTVLVAGALELFGNSLVAARIPALLAGLAWVGLVFEWTRRVAGPGAAWVAGLFFAFDPLSIHLSQFARFYTFHGLFFWAGAVGVYWLVEAQSSAPRKRLLVGGAAALALAASSYFQPTAAIGVAALAVWGAGRWLWGAMDDRGEVVERLVVLGVAAAAAAGAAYASGVLQEMWATYRTAADWAEHRTGQWRYYHWWLEGRFPVLWRLYPLAVLVSLRHRARGGLFSVVLFVIPLLLHSFAGQKHERYLAYAIPFFFVTWGVALSSVLPALRSAARRVWEGMRIARGREGWLRGLTACTLAAVLALPVYTSPAFKTTVGMVADDGPERPYGQPDWTAAADDLRPLALGKDVVLAARAAKAMYYLGRADAEVVAGPPVDWVLRPVRGFQVDDRIGLPVLHTRDELSAVLRCHESGLVVIERARWEGLEERAGGALARTVVEATEEVSVPEAWGLVVREWSDRSGTEARECSSVRAVTGRSSPPSRTAERDR